MIMITVMAAGGVTAQFLVTIGPGPSPALGAGVTVTELTGSLGGRGTQWQSDQPGSGDPARAVRRPGDRQAGRGSGI